MSAPNVASAKTTRAAVDCTASTPSAASDNGASK